MNDQVNAFRALLETLDRVGAENAVNQALATLTPIQVIDRIVVPALEEIGRAWESGEVALSQVYMSGRICEALVEAVLPPSDPDRKHQPRSAIVTLSDFHMMGKRIVYSHMRASGFELFDYGRMDVDELVDRVLADKIRVLMISVLMLPSALKVADVCRRLNEAGLAVSDRRWRALSVRREPVARGGRRCHGAQRRRGRHAGQRVDGGDGSMTMTSMQRTLTALGHGEPDRVPLFLLLTEHGARELGLSIEAYFSCAEYVIEGQLRLHRKYHTDCLYAFYYASIEVEAWGGSTLFIEDGPPLCAGPIIRSPAQIDSLQAPAITEAAGLGRVLDTIRGLKAQVGDTVPIIGVAISPFSLPVMQMGFDHYLDLIHEQPARFEHLMAANIEFTVEWANAQLDAGATAICYFDPVSSTTSIPRELYLTTGMDVARRVLPRIKGPTATHMASGRVMPILGDIADTGTAIVGVSALEDLAELKAVAHGRVTLLGNLNGIEMRRWTPAQAEFAVKQAIAKAGRGGGFLLGENHGEVPYLVPDEVLLAISAAAERWGRYPLDWVEAWQK